MLTLSKFKLKNLLEEDFRLFKALLEPLKNQQHYII